MNIRLDGGAIDSEAERAGWVQRYRASGLGLKRFAAKHGLTAGQLRYWTYGSGLSSAVTVPMGAPVFQEVASPLGWKAPQTWAAEIGLPDGATIRLDSRADIAWIQNLVESLRRPCSR